MARASPARSQHADDDTARKCRDRLARLFPSVEVGEQAKRFEARLKDDTKNWKFSPADTKERKYWDEYMKAYEDALEATSTDEAPWYVIPADHKWFTRLAVADVVVEALESLDLHLEVDPEMTVRQSHDIAHNVRLRILETLDWVADVLVHVEPAP